MNVKITETIREVAEDILSQLEEGEPVRASDFRALKSSSMPIVYRALKALREHGVELNLRRVKGSQDRKWSLASPAGLPEALWSRAYAVRRARRVQELELRLGQVYGLVTTGKPGSKPWPGDDATADVLVAVHLALEGEAKSGEVVEVLLVEMGAEVGPSPYARVWHARLPGRKPEIYADGPTMLAALRSLREKWEEAGSPPLEIYTEEQAEEIRIRIGEEKELEAREWWASRLRRELPGGGRRSVLGDPVNG